MLARNGKTNVATLVRQIEIFGGRQGYRERARTAIQYIRRLVNLCDERPEAMRLLLDAAYEYCRANYEHPYHTTNFEEHDGSIELDPVDKLMCELIREHYTAAPSSTTGWDPTMMTEEILETRGEGNYSNGDFEDYYGVYCPPCFEEEFDQKDRKHLFKKSIRLLKLVCAREAATMLAEAVTADFLPPELVEMVRDSICDDEELRVAVS